MASDTFASRSIGAVYAGEAGKETRRGMRKINEAGIYPSMAIRVHTDNFLYLAKNSDKIFSGIAADMPGEDLDTVYASGDIIEYFGATDDVDVWVWYVAQSPAVNLVEGDVLVLSATDGMFMKFAYANATDITDVTDLTGTVRLVDDVVTGSATNNQLIRVHLS